jgi:hypothetical protein
MLMYQPISLWPMPLYFEVDFSNYQFISIDKKSFIPVMLEPMENRLNPK